MEVDTSIYRSPKRKRGHSIHGPPLVTSGLSQKLSPPPDQHPEVGSYSPSTRVTGKFQKLNIRSPIDLPPSFINYSPVEEQPPSAGHTSGSLANAGLTQEFKPLEPADFTFESPINKTIASKLNSVGTETARGKSPPPSSVVSDQFWHSSEITGWSPDDPDEDYYGVNGVGYAKTASTAYAISQKRKQQIADYRSRETKEARQRRHEKRRSGFNSRRESPKGSPSSASKSEDSVSDRTSGSSDRKGVRFVHFEDG